MHAPIIKDIENVNIPDCEKRNLSGVPCYILKGGTQEIVKLQIILHAGRKYESKPAQARMANILLKEGCAKYDADTFAHIVDNYGFSLKVSSDLDFAYVTLICMKKFFAKGFALIKAMMASPNFSEDDLSRIANIASQNLKAQLNKNELVCYRAFTEKLFGPDHIYGYNTDPSSYMDLTRHDMTSFFKAHYDLSKMKIILSGHVDESIIEQIDFDVVGGSHIYKYTAPKQIVAERLVLEGRQKIQSAVKIGRRLFSRSHEDYIDMFILNTILGGYFGSRLMSNIREDKGFAYNIYSIIDTMSNDGYLSINCELGNEHVEQTIEEIEKEVDLLRTELIPEDELKMVRNYMLGQIMHSLDGPLATSELFSSLISNGLDQEFLQKIIARIKFITNFELLTTAQKYLHFADFSTVIVGQKS